MNCYIWNTAASTFAQPPCRIEIVSARAGGKYRVTNSVISQLRNITLQQKKAITSWLHSEREAGNESPEITDDNVRAIILRKPLMLSEKATAALRFFDTHLQNLNDYWTLDLDKPSSEMYEMMAACEIGDEGELRRFLQVLNRMEYIEGTEHSSGWRYRLTAKGHLKLEEIYRQRPDSQQAFIAMWFDETTQVMYDNCIAKAVIDCGYRPLRIDKKEHINKIDDEIIGEIRRSRFVIADFTCPPNQPRGGVYYEAGFAAGLGIPVIWSANATSIGDLHFDTRQYNHIPWNSPDELYEKLRKRIGAVIGDGPLK